MKSLPDPCVGRRGDRRVKMGRTLAKKRNAEVADGPARAPFDHALRAIALAGIYGALLAIVVVVQDATAYPFVFLKTMVLQAIISLTVPAFLLLVWRQPTFRPRRSW